ncbi:hypothetical protein HPB47_018252 [Ixodes persulcatus]|uniref:Uncharacterized protein n=1 Tax=Ixodes persulcatus TaxID=34615 RepID=A0AC60QLC2_IXOPE|nr:hypothetical protein HPB47_018252 [Ixodes persulcatus]
MGTVMHDKDQEAAQKQSTANVIRLTVSHLAPFFLLPMVYLFQSPVVRCIYIIAVMILEWILEPVPFQITSFFPLIMGPLLNLGVTRDLAKFYLNEPIANSIAGLTVTLIAQNCGLNKRISYNIILLVGAQIKWLMLAFMTLVFLLSMFVSNVAVTSIMMCVVDTLIFEISTTELDIRKNELRQQRDTQEEEEHRVDVCPKPAEKRCHACNTVSPEENYECIPSSGICGRRHPTGNKKCRKLFKTPHVLVRRRWEQTQLRKEEEPMFKAEDSRRSGHPDRNVENPTTGIIAPSSVIGPDPRQGVTWAKPAPPKKEAKRQTNDVAQSKRLEEKIERLLREVQHQQESIAKLMQENESLRKRPAEQAEEKAAQMLLPA